MNVTIRKMLSILLVLVLIVTLLVGCGLSEKKHSADEDSEKVKSTDHHYSEEISQLRVRIKVPSKSEKLRILTKDVEKIVELYGGIYRTKMFYNLHSFNISLRDIYKNTPKEILSEYQEELSYRENHVAKWEKKFLKQNREKLKSS